MEQSALVLKGLEKSFTGFKLGPLDLTVPEGAIYGFIGPNASGKTTTIDLIMGMGEKEAGTIRVFGLDPDIDEVAVKKRIGYVGPDLSFNAWGKIGRLVGFFRSFYEDWDDALCTDLMTRLRLGWNDKIATLSFGSRTKLSLLLALSHRPSLLLLDEPLAGLDAVAKQEVFAELLDAVKDEKRTVLISSHGLDDIERFADHLGILSGGNLLLEGPTAELVNRFRMVDCTAANGKTPHGLPGVRVQRQEGTRWRVLADTKEGALDRLTSQGMSDLVDSPVSLEELFVALVKEG